jgi:hypothetical protein
VSSVSTFPETLCPDRRHQVQVAPNAATGLQSLESGVRQRLVEMLCDVAEVAALAPTAVDFSARWAPSTLRAGESIVFYSLDAAHAVTVHHVVQAALFR